MITGDIRRTWKSSTKHHKIKLGYKVCQPAQPRSSSGYWYPSIRSLPTPWRRGWFSSTRAGCHIQSTESTPMLLALYYPNTLRHLTEYLNICALYLWCRYRELRTLDIYQPRGSSWSSPIPSTLSYWLLRSHYGVLRITGFSASKHCRWTNYCTVLCTEYTYSYLAMQYVRSIRRVFLISGNGKVNHLRSQRWSSSCPSRVTTLDCWSISNDEIHTYFVLSSHFTSIDF